MKITVIVYGNIVEEIEQTILSVKNNSKWDETEIILMNYDEKDEELEKLCEKYTNVTHILVEDKNKAEAFNIGLSKAKGEYVTFIDQGTTYSKDALKKVVKCAKNKQAQVICMHPYFVVENTKKRYKMSHKIEEVNLKEKPNKLNLAFDSYFFNTKTLKYKKFNEDICQEDAELKVLLEVLEKNNIYYNVDAEMYYKNAKDDNTSMNFMQYNKNWYTNSLKNFVIPFLKKFDGKEAQEFVQEALLYYIYAKYNCNLNDRNKMVLNAEEAKEFFTETAKALKYIDNNLILGNVKGSLFKIPRWLAYELVLNKEKNKNKKIDIITDQNHFWLKEHSKNKKNNKYKIGNIIGEFISFYAINYNKGKLEFDFTIGLQDFIDAKELEVYATYKGEKIYANKTEFYPLLKCFGLTIRRKIPFHIEIEIGENNKNEEISIHYVYKENDEELRFKFYKVQSHLNSSRFSYWKINKNYYLKNRNKRLVIQKKKIFTGITNEIKYFLARIYRAKRKIFTIKYFGLRFSYFISKIFTKNKQIWITFDKLYKAGDNGEYILKYIMENKKDVSAYYIIKKDSLDYKRLKKYSRTHVLTYGSFKQKLISLLSTAILDTHANAVSYCSFDTKRARNYICDLFNSEVICIQHGLSIQKIAQYQNRLFDNIKLYCCASKYELENLLSTPMYDFKPEQLKLTGLARYDGLKSKSEKIILITPTWRRNIVNSNVAHMKKKHNNFFINSTYYKIYNTLINDEKLINKAKEKGYKIIYLLHPAISAQKADFTPNEYVELMAATDNMNYEDILTRSSLMVTDYSGVQFDFAYMRKVLVYYHPDELPPHYEAGGLKYDTMGFGPICKNNEQIVNTLCAYMDNDCKTEEKYIKRADDFFAFNDHNNCERIYNEIKKYMEEKSK